MAKVTLRPTVSQSVRLGVEPQLGLITGYQVVLVTCLSMSGAPSDERAGLSFVIVTVRLLSKYIQFYMHNTW
jgi:hypothetical protein